MNFINLGRVKGHDACRLVPDFVVVVPSLSDSVLPRELQNSRIPYPPLSPGVDSDSCLLSQWCYPTISSSVVPFSSCLQSFLASGSFLMSQLFTSGGQNIGVSALASVLPMNTQDWSPLEWTGWISLGLGKSPRDFQDSYPQVHMCSPSWTLLPPPSPYHPSGLSQCTSPKHPVSCIEPGLVTRSVQASMF